MGKAVADVTVLIPSNSGLISRPDKATGKKTEMS